MAELEFLEWMERMGPNLSQISTIWGDVEAAKGVGPQADAALARLMAVYYQALNKEYVFLGYSIAEAQERAHEFLDRFIDRSVVRGADPSRGQFRNYVMQIIKVNEKFRWREGKRRKESPLVEVDLVSDQSTPPDCFNAALADEIYSQSLELTRRELAFSKPCLRILIEYDLVASSQRKKREDFARELGISLKEFEWEQHIARKTFKWAIDTYLGDGVSDISQAREEYAWFLTWLRKALRGGGESKKR